MYHFVFQHHLLDCLDDLAGLLVGGPGGGGSGLVPGPGGAGRGGLITGPTLSAGLTFRAPNFTKLTRLNKNR